MRIQNLSLILVLGSLVVYGCVVTSHSDAYENLLKQPTSRIESGRSKFLYGDMGGIYPHTLKTNAFAYKIAVVALLTRDSSLLPENVFNQYGFIYPSKIDGWPNAPISTDKPAGLIFGKLNGTHPSKGKYFVETADFGCATCHASPLYGSDGLPTGQFVPGMPNASINLQALANDLYEGYKTIIVWSESMFLDRITRIYPNMPKDELIGTAIMFRGLQKGIKRIMATRGHVSPYKIGGPGNMNGVGAVKMGLNMLDRKTFHPQENSQVSIPALIDRNFRSSLLVSGNYAPIHDNFFYRVDSVRASHNQSLAPIAALFTVGTMGFNASAAARAIPDVKEVMKFLSTLSTSPFPKSIEEQKASLGREIFIEHCQSCHGVYSGGATHNKLASFPNRFISLTAIKTDSVRAVAITKKDLNKLKQIKLGNYFKGEVHKGYVAPILTGLWATAPYLHNGSVPTLWHLMHPESRPQKFYVGGHKLDYDKVGIDGVQVNDVYKYPADYKPWSRFAIYNTQESALSNQGHEEPFVRLTEEQKENLLEFLKTL